jgi:hypothetical protein
MWMHMAGAVLITSREFRILNRPQITTSVRNQEPVEIPSQASNFIKILASNFIKILAAVYCRKV